MQKEPLKVIPVNIPCYGFVPPNSQESQKASVVLVPLRVEEEEKSLFISWSCSHGAFCCNPYCHYAKKAKEIKKE